MAEPMGSTDEAALWRRWRHVAQDGGAAGAEPDELTLAAYAESRLDAEAVEAVEDWLAVNPQAARDVLAARQALALAGSAASEAIIARATMLVGAGGSGSQVLAFRRPQTRPSWRRAAAWGAVAASILVASLAGFAMGNTTYVSLAGGTPSSLSQDLLDPPIGLFNSSDEDSSI
jgi:anti-sigma factor RsiW